MTVHYLSNARPEPARPDRTARDRAPVRTVSREPDRETRRRDDGRLVGQRASLDEPSAAAESDDNTTWLLTFSDLVLLLFAFVTVSVSYAHTRPAPAERPAAPAITAPVAAAEPRVEPPIVPARPPREALPQRRSERIAVDLPAFEVEPPRLDVALPAFAVEPRPLDIDAPAAVVEPPPLHQVPDGEVAPLELAAAAPADAAAPATGARLATVGRYLRAFGAATGLGDALTVTDDESALVVDLGDDAGFASGRADLAPAALPLLREIRILALEMPDLTIEVGGHTDDVPMHSSLFTSNLELSLARAARVAHAIAGADRALAARIVTAGFAEHRAAVPNTDASGRARNRRVELRLREHTVGQLSAR